MQIALTKKLASALGLKLPATAEEPNPLFMWTANWMKVWENRKADDLLVLVNHATRFAVAVYQFKRKDLKNFDRIMRAAIENTMFAMNFNPEVVADYFAMAGEIQYVPNRGGKTSAWTTKAGLDCGFHVDALYNRPGNVFDDTLASSLNQSLVGYTAGHEHSFVPFRAMSKALADLTGKPIHRYRAFELEVTLDLEIYTVLRRLLVPANLTFDRFHKVLQSAFSWRDNHLYEYRFPEREGHASITMLPLADALGVDEKINTMSGRTLAEIFPEHPRLDYIYDFGDNWVHEIRFVREIEDYDKPSPYLLEAEGRTPPEDVGGVGGFLSFRDAYLDPDHPDYQEAHEWARYWSPELNDWDKRPSELRL